MSSYSHWKERVSEYVVQVKSQLDKEKYSCWARSAQIRQASQFSSPGAFGPCISDASPRRCVHTRPRQYSRRHEPSICQVLASYVHESFSRSLPGTAIPLALSTARVDLLHLEPVLALRLALGDPQLLKVDVGRVVDRAGAARDRTLLRPEVIEHLGLDGLAARHLQLGVEVTAELRLSGARGVEVRRDLPADHITRLEHGDGVRLLAREMNAVESSTRGAGRRDFGLLLCGRGRGSRHGQTGELSLLEPSPGSVVDVAVDASIHAGLLQESVDGGWAAADGVAEFSLLEDSTLDDLADEGSDSIAIHVKLHVFNVNMVKVLLVVGDGLIRRDVGLALPAGGSTWCGCSTWRGGWGLLDLRPGAVSRRRVYSKMGRQEEGIRILIGCRCLRRSRHFDGGLLVRITERRGFIPRSGLLSLPVVASRGRFPQRYILAERGKRHRGLICPGSDILESWTRWWLEKRVSMAAQSGLGTEEESCLPAEVEELECGSAFSPMSPSNESIDDGVHGDDESCLLGAIDAPTRVSRH